MNPTRSALPFNLEDLKPLLGALHAQCRHDMRVFNIHFAAVQRIWGKDPLAGLGHATFLAALAAKQVLVPAHPEEVALAATFGFVAEQPVPDELKVRTVDLVMSYAKSEGPNMVDALGTDPLVWRHAGAVMNALTAGLVCLDALHRNCALEDSYRRLFAPVTEAPPGPLTGRG